MQLNSLINLAYWFQSPKKINLVAALVRGMRVEDALLQLQVTVKRASKTVYQVIQPFCILSFFQLVKSGSLCRSKEKFERK